MKHITLLIMALGVVIMACTKDPNEFTNGECRLLSVSSDPDVIEATFEYGSSGKITRQTLSDGSYDTYIVESGEVVVRSYTRDGQLIQHLDKQIYTLNAQGYIGKKVDIHPGDTDTHIFTYSPEGYQIKEEVFDHNGKLETTYNFTVVDGNTVKSESINAGNGEKKTDTYTFLQVENKAGLGGFPKGEGGLAKYYGKANKDLMNALTFSNGTSLTFYYDMDGDLVKYMKITQPGFSTVMERWYTYENCK